MLNIALALAAASAASASPTLTSTAPWWEKVTVTIAPDGTQSACEYRTNLPGGGAQNCEVENAAASPQKASAGDRQVYTKITFERRFTPGAQPDLGSLEHGDTLLAGQVLALAIGGDGTVRGCETVVASGDARPSYGCTEARAERFNASARRLEAEPLQGFLTVLVYGHLEQIA